mgnify:CR=1 FL=1
MLESDDDFDSDPVILPPEPITRFQTEYASGTLSRASRHHRFFMVVLRAQNIVETIGLPNEFVAFAAPIIFGAAVFVAGHISTANTSKSVGLGILAALLTLAFSYLFLLRVPQGEAWNRVVATSEVLKLRHPSNQGPLLIQAVEMLLGCIGYVGVVCWSVLWSIPSFVLEYNWAEYELRSNNRTSGTSGTSGSWGKILTFTFWAIVVLVSFNLLMWNMPPGGYNSSTSSSSSSSTSPTEAKLKAVYRANGTTYDDRMLREDARQVEIMAREQGMTIDQSVIIWSTQR